MAENKKKVRARAKKSVEKVEVLIADLRHCALADCEKCQHENKVENCIVAIFNEAADTIEQLQADLRRKLSDKSALLDKAVEDLQHCEDRCNYCLHKYECDGNACGNGSPINGDIQDYWEWRGDAEK